MLLSVKQLSKTVHNGAQKGDQNGDTLAIVDQVDLTLQPGETLAIVGASGSGKSTLLSLLAGLDQPSAGEVYLLDQPLHELDDDTKAALRLDHVGFIFQSFRLIPTLTALQNVATPLKLRAIHAKQDQLNQIEQQAEALLAKLGLGNRLHHRPAELSGGEQQRVAIARAVIARPKILFADEPTGNLDSRRSQMVCDWLFSDELWLDQPPGQIVVTHDHEVAERCQTIREMSDGHLAAPTTASQR